MSPKVKYFIVPVCALLLGVAQVAHAACNDRRSPGMDWSGCKKTNKMLNKSDFSGSRFDDADLSLSDLVNSDFTGASLVKTDLTRVDATRSRFVNADLSKAGGYRATFDRATLVDSKRRLVKIGTGSCRFQRSNPGKRQFRIFEYLPDRTRRHAARQRRFQGRLYLPQQF